MDKWEGGGYCLFSTGVATTGGEEIDWIAIGMGALAAVSTLVLLAVIALRERKARRRFQILADIASVSEAGGSLEETFDAICAILVPEMGDFCMIDVIDEERIPRR